MKNIILIAITFLITQVFTQFKIRDICIQGVKMLTRVKQADGTYTLDHVCICPIDYWGEHCRYHRTIQCYLSPKSMTPSQINPQNYDGSSTKDVVLQTTLECYIAESKNNYVLIPQYLMERELKPQKLLYSLENVQEGGEVIWANHTSIFDSEGEVKYIEGHNYTFVNGKKRMSQEEEQRIMHGSGPIEFVYKDNFMGIPLTDSNFYVTPYILRPTTNRIIFPKQQFKLENTEKYMKWFNESYTRQAIEDLSKEISIDDLLDDPNQIKDLINELNGIRKKNNQMAQLEFLPYIKTNISVNINDSVEFHTIRIQIALKQFYDHNLYVEETGINAIEFMLPVKLEGVGDAEVYSINFNQKTIPRYVYVLIASVLVGIVYLIVSWRKRKQKEKNMKIQKDIQEMQEDLAWK